MIDASRVYLVDTIITIRMKTYLITLLALAIIPNAFSQVTMTINGTSVASGSQYDYQASHPLGSPGAESMELRVNNAGSVNMELKVERCKITDVPGWTINSTEWAGEDPLTTGVHYNSSIMTGECWTTLDPITASSGSYVIFKDYLTSTDVSCALYRYYVLEMGVRVDSVDVEYCRTSLSVGELDNSELIVYPNPSTDFISFKGEKGQFDAVKVTSVSGQEVMSFDGVPNLIDVRSIPEGHYTVSLMRKDGVTVTRRMTILR